MNAWKVSCNETISDALGGSVPRTLSMDSSFSSRDCCVYLEEIHSAITSRKSSQLPRSPVELTEKRASISVAPQSYPRTWTYLGLVSFRVLSHFLWSLQNTCPGQLYDGIDAATHTTARSVRRRAHCLPRLYSQLSDEKVYSGFPLITLSIESPRFGDSRGAGWRIL